MKLAAQRLVLESGGLELERLERHVVEPRGFFVRQRVGCTVSSTRRVIDRLVRGVGRCGLDEVIGEVRERRVGPSLRQSFDRLADAPVEPYAPRRRQLAVERLANECVHEGRSCPAARHFCDQLRLHGFVDGVEQPTLRQVAERFEHLDVEFAADHSGQAQCPIGRLAQA